MNMYVLIWIVLLSLFAREHREVIAEPFRNLLQHNSDIDCETANLKVLADTNVEMNNITVSFALNDAKFNDCFESFYIFLVSQTEVKNYNFSVIKVPLNLHHNETKSYSYTFKNVTCGLYQVLIQPCYNELLCPLLVMDYPTLMNMSSADCKGNHLSLARKGKPSLNIEKEIIIGLGFACLIVIIAISGCIYYNLWSGIKTHYDSKNAEYVEGNKVLLRPDIHLYIFHFFDGSNEIRKRVNILKRILLESSSFKSIKTIDDELAVIQFTEDGWSIDVLEKTKKMGGLKKIILVDSEEYNDENYEMENLIFSRFLNKLTNDLERCITDYHNLFVVQFDGINTSSERIRNIVKRTRYQIPRDINDLCFNLSLVSQPGISEV